MAVFATRMHGFLGGRDFIIVIVISESLSMLSGTWKVMIKSCGSELNYR